MPINLEPEVHPAHPSNFQKEDQWGRRWYFDPLPADDTWPATNDEWPAVSTVKKAWGKEFTKYLPGGPKVSLDAYRVAVYAFSEHEWRDQNDPDDAVAMLARSAKDALDNDMRRGTQIHDGFEAGARGHKWTPGKLAAPYAHTVRRWFEEVKPEPLHIEACGINRTLGYGGALDLMALIDGQIRIEDYKSRGATAGHGCYEDEAAQCGAYVNLEYLIVFIDGALMRLPMPKVVGADIVSVKPDDYAMYPIDLDGAFEAFRSMLRMWHDKKGGMAAARRSIGKPRVAQSVAAHRPNEGGEITAAQRQQLIAKLKQSHPAVRTSITEWQQQATRAGASFHMLDCPSERRYQIATAAIGLATLLATLDGFGDGHARGLVAYATGNDDAHKPSIHLGAVLGALEIDEAQAVVELVDTYGQYPVRRRDSDGAHVVGEAA